MLSGTIEHLQRAADLVARCMAEDARDQAELTKIVGQLQGLIYRLNGIAVRKVAGV